MARREPSSEQLARLLRFAAVCGPAALISRIRRSPAIAAAGTGNIQPYFAAARCAHLGPTTPVVWIDDRCLAADVPPSHLLVVIVDETFTDKLEAARRTGRAAQLLGRALPPAWPGGGSRGAPPSAEARAELAPQTRPKPKPV